MADLSDHLDVVHIVGALGRFLDWIGVKVPRALCGELLVAEPGRPDPDDRAAPICPRCAEIARWDAAKIAEFNAAQKQKAPTLRDKPPALTWRETIPGQVWRSTCGRYAIVAHTLPENPPHVEYVARKIDPSMARAYPKRHTLGFFLGTSPWCWNRENEVHSAQAQCEQDAYCSAQDRQFPADFPAVALERFGAGYREALVIAWEDGDLVARVMHMGLRTHKEGFVPQKSNTVINLTGLGLVPRDGVQLDTVTEHDVDRCGNCGVKFGQAHDDGCSFAKCLVTGQQRLLCSTFGGSPTAGIIALATGGSQQEFDDYFKTPTGHDCGRDVYLG
jgi:hypothetical protein